MAFDLAAKYNPYPTNADRAHWARLALDTFEGPEGPYHRPGTEPTDTVAVDLIVNLMHLVARDCGIDPRTLLDTARMHYEAEAED